MVCYCEGEGGYCIVRVCFIVDLRADNNELNAPY